MSERTAQERLPAQLGAAFRWALGIALLTVPLGYVALFGAGALFSLWLLVFLVAKALRRSPRALDYSYLEFMLIWGVAALLWYPLWRVGLLLYIGVAAFISGL